METAIKIRLTGTRPMLMHNSRLANPLDPYTRDMKKITSKRKKTDEDLARLMHLEARGGCWETEDGLLGVPDYAVFRSILDSARMNKRGKDIERGLSAEGLVAPILIGGKTVLCDDFLQDPDHIDASVVGNRGNKILRSRPKIPKGWESEHDFTVLTELIDIEDLADIVERAGRLQRIGDYRQRYGKYLGAVEVTE